MGKIKFSLIMCTIGRVDTLADAINSILSQTYHNYELIIVDQNKEEILKPIIDRFHLSNKIKHIRSNVVGLSANRNIGLHYATGDIVAFPDDDCMYLPNTLETVMSLFENNKGLNFLTINIKGIKSDIFFINCHKQIVLDRFNFKQYAISIGIFVKIKNKEDVHFDELLGAGKYFGAAEESDMVSSIIEKGYSGTYFGDCYVLHPVGVQESCIDKVIARYKSYNLGFGALMKKEIIIRKKYRLLPKFILEISGRFLGGIIPNKKRRLLWISFKHQIKGFIEYKN